MPRNKNVFGGEVKAIPLADSILESIAANGVAWIEGAVFNGEMPVGIIVSTGWAVEHVRELCRQLKEAIEKGGVSGQQQRDKPAGA